eukprot:SAG25_NODE_1710_length_2496_cov_1.985398_2_plen_153_part_00
MNISTDFLVAERGCDQSKGRMCQDPAELAIIAEEGSPMGPLLRAVNEIARAVAAAYPQVAVDTLAYQYTQPPPAITKPEPNVIIRLCDIQSNAGAPLTDPSNANFDSVLRGWSKLTKRIWMCVVFRRASPPSVCPRFDVYYACACVVHVGLR